MERYDAHTTEAKWQRVWADADAFRVEDALPQGERSEKSYVVEMWPYPSGTLHMGTASSTRSVTSSPASAAATAGACCTRSGFDSFGLPAENAAIREGGHPREITERNITNITRSMRRMGWALDFSRMISAHEPTYYKWDQWLFLRLFEADLAYRKAAPVKWCPVDQVVLANEQVHDGHCEYCGAEVEAKYLEQWFFRTTAYAQELLDDLDQLDWFEKIKTMQRNWIGRSEGAEILFRIDELDDDVAGLHDAARHAVRRDVLRARAGASARRELIERSPHARRVARLRAARRGEARRGARRRRGEDRRLHRLLRDEPGQRARRSRSGSPTTC